MAIRILLYLIGGLFGLLALLALAQAIFIGFSQIVSLGWAALLAAVSYLLIMGIMLLLTQLGRRHRRRTTFSRLTPLFTSEVQRRPARSALIALAAGALLEYLERRVRR